MITIEAVYENGRLWAACGKQPAWSAGPAVRRTPISSPWVRNSLRVDR